MEKYVYMVTFTFSGGGKGSGTGRVFVTRESPISTPEHIEGIEAVQNARRGYTCAVTGFFLLSHTTDDETQG